MGGNALKKVVATRIKLKTYRAIQSEIVSRFKGELVIEYPIELPNKTDFGDVDVLFSFKDCTGDIKAIDAVQKNRVCKLIRDAYDPIDMVCNGQVYSFSYKHQFAVASSKFDSDQHDRFPVSDNADGGHVSLVSESVPVYYQVDFIHCPSVDLLPMYHFFFSLGDTGSILGRIMKSHGLSLGFQGLFISVDGDFLNKYLTEKSRQNAFQEVLSECLPVSSALSHDDKLDLHPEKTYDKIILSTSPRDICSFIGLEYRYANGSASAEEERHEEAHKESEAREHVWEPFVSVEDIYRWICSCKLLVLETFNSAMNHEHSHRCAKRQFYGGFIEYLEQELARHRNLVATSQSGFKVITADRRTDADADMKLLVRQQQAMKLGENIQMEACRHFNKLAELDAVLERERQLQTCRRKFNGELVQQWYAEIVTAATDESNGTAAPESGPRTEASRPELLRPASLTGKELGMTIREFKEQVVLAQRIKTQTSTADVPSPQTPDEVFGSWLSQTTPADVETEVRAFLTKHII